MRKYAFAQIAVFLPQRQFIRIVKKNLAKTQKKSFSYWKHLLMLMFGQLKRC
ncbi:MAG: DUF4372 domain-containing protein [Bacteroidales bacterium]|nr:DUF4372 domain-containing protein [Bacteroidales bacterium]